MSDIRSVCIAMIVLAVFAADFLSHKWNMEGSAEGWGITSVVVLAYAGIFYWKRR